MTIQQSIAKHLLFFVLSVFFREADGLNVDKLPPNDPLIFVCAPHANQFLDPIMVQKMSGRDVGFLAAAVSMRRRFVGAMARAMRAIPVARPQDLAKKGVGSVTNEGTTITGKGTVFTKEASPGDTFSSSGQTSLIVEVVSDTELKIKTPLEKQLTDASFKIVPKIDQTEVYESVYEVLSKGGCIGIFPEGGSHDRTELLPLKAGFTIMALGALSKHPNINLKIVPAGLNYYRAHAFRSSAYVDFGSPITIPPELVEMFNQGGEKKKEACSTLLAIVNEGIKGVTVNAPDYETLQMFQAARRLYKPPGVKLTPNQKLQLNRAFAQGYERAQDNPQVQEFRNKFLEYKELLTALGLKDHQVKRIPDHNKCRALALLMYRSFVLLVLLMLSIPGLLLTSPLITAAILIPKKKAREALAASSVKVAGRDVLATWKVFIGLGMVPILWLAYTAAVAVLVPLLAPSLPLWARIVIPIGAFIAIPILFYATVIFLERSRSIFLSLPPLFVGCFSSRNGKELKALRIELQNELRVLVEMLGPKTFENFQQTRVIQKDKFEQQIFVNPLANGGPSEAGPSGEDSSSSVAAQVTVAVDGGQDNSMSREFPSPPEGTETAPLVTSSVS